jgi:formylglycine-generating enzyme required for sulfatase activity
MGANPSRFKGPKNPVENVRWDQCQDWKEPYTEGSATDPVGPSSGSVRVWRGGSWGDSPTYRRSANRGGYDPSDSRNNYGFRVVLLPR